MIESKTARLKMINPKKIVYQINTRLDLIENDLTKIIRDPKMSIENVHDRKNQKRKLGPIVNLLIVPTFNLDIHPIIVTNMMQSKFDSTVLVIYNE